MMQVEETAIPAVKIVTPKKHGDARGFFSEVYNRADWDKAGLQLTFVQDNHSFSATVGTLRGLHFQTPPFAQDKLVRCTRGRILDVAVDIRRSSPTSAAMSRSNCQRKPAPGARSDRVCARLHHFGARRRSSLQDDCALFGRQ